MPLENSLNAFVAQHEAKRRELKNQLHNTPCNSPDLLSLAKQLQHHTNDLLPAMRQKFSL